MALDFELEKCRRREQLLELRDRLDRESHEARQKREHDYWLEAQRRRIQALRVEKALQREVDTAEVALDPYAPQKMPYDASTGFGVVLDGRGWAGVGLVTAASITYNLGPCLSRAADGGGVTEDETEVGGDAASYQQLLPPAAEE